jgi:hypothetical protein
LDSFEIRSIKSMRFLYFLIGTENRKPKETPMNELLINGQGPKGNSMH